MMLAEFNSAALPEKNTFGHFDTMDEDDDAVPSKKRRKRKKEKQNNIEKGKRFIRLAAMTM